MGIAKGACSLLFELKTTVNFQGTICQLGRQSCYISETELGNISKKFGFSPPHPVSSSPWCGVVDDEILFRSLGFTVVESLDADSYENSTYIVNLNEDLPLEINGRFDVVYDGGTLEHVFNFPQCLKNIYKMLKPGGIVIHALPCNNHVDHGFYQFSPTLFYDYYTENKWKILRSYIFEHTTEHATKPWLIYNYFPGEIDHLSYGGWNQNMLGLWFVAEKNQESSCDVIPMQGSYIRTWSKFKEDKRTKSNIISRKLDQLKDIAKSNENMYYFCLNLKIIINSLLLLIRKACLRKPKVIAKY